MTHSARREALADNDRILYTPAAAVFLGVQENTLYQWRRRGNGPDWHRDARGRPCYVKRDLLAWRKDRES